MTLNRWLLGLILASALALCFLSVGPTDAQAQKAPPAKTGKAGTKPEPPPAEPPVPHINYLFPAGGQRGKTVEISIVGMGLDGANAIRILGDGVTGQVTKIVETPAPAVRTAMTAQPPATKTVSASIVIAPDATPGMRDLRVVTPAGVSNRVRFIVGLIPEVNEVEPNGEPGQTQRLESLPAVVNGQIMPADRDFYRFAAKAGQTIVCEVDARTLQPYIADAVPGWLQSVLTLYNEAGSELAYVDSFRFKPDPVLIYKVPQDGEYTLSIRDSIYRGREDFIYRLSIGELPFITHFYPLGAKRETATQVELHGVNLPQQSMTVKPPVAQMSLAACGTGGGTPPVASRSNALPFAGGEYDEVNEVEPDDSQAQAHRIKPPVTVNGRIQKPGDVDWFVFAAEAKQELVFDVRARRLDSPLDSVIAVFDSKGTSLAANDDTVDESEPLITHHADSRLAVTFPAAGDYFVRIGDTQGKGGDEYAYRLTIAASRPDFALRILPDNPRIAPGDTVVITAAALRKDGFDCEIKLTLAGLPRGYDVRGAWVPAKEGEARFTITAPADASVGLLSPTMTGTGKVAGQMVVRQALPAEQVMQAFSYTHRVPTQEFVLAVVPPSFFSLSTDLSPDAVLEIPQGGEAQVAVKIVRAKEGIGNIALAANQPPRGITARGASVAGDKNEGTITITVQKQVPVGFTQNVIVAGTLRIGKDTITRFAPAIPVRVTAAPPAPKPQ